MKTMIEEKLLRSALEVEQPLSPAEAARLADHPELTSLRRDAEYFVSLPAAVPEVPPALSDRIRAEARRRNAFRPAAGRRRKILVPFAAAAALLLGFGLVFLNLNTASPADESAAITAVVAGPVMPAAEIDRNMLALADWSSLDQEVYNLSFELNSRQFAVTESMTGDIL